MNTLARPSAVHGSAPALRSVPASQEHAAPRVSRPNPSASADWIPVVAHHETQPGLAPALVTVPDNPAKRHPFEAKPATSASTSKTAAHGVILTGPDRAIRTANSAFSSITGYSRDEVIGRNCKFLQGPLTDLRVVAAIQLALKNGTEFSGTIRNYRKDGSTFWNHLTISPVRDPVGEITHYIGIIREIRASQPAESALVATGERTEEDVSASAQVPAKDAPDQRPPSFSAPWPGTPDAGTMRARDAAPVSRKPSPDPVTHWANIVLGALLRSAA